MESISGPIGLIRESFEIFFKRKNFLYFIKIYLPFFVFSLFQVLQRSSNFESELAKGNFQYFSDKPFLIAFVILMGAIGLVLGIWFGAASLESILRVVNSETLSFRDTYKKAWRYAFKLFLAGLLIGVIVLAGLVLLVIPAVIFATWFVFTRFGIAQDNLGVVAALKQSKSLVSGRFWKVFGRLIVFMFFAILGQIVFSIIPFIGAAIGGLFGALFALPYLLLYKELSVR